jgi:NAD(P)-dependent dehydrogenase (short-subunit alcohol dehydrogenase family)
VAMVNNADTTRDATTRKISGDQFDLVIQVHLLDGGTAPPKRREGVSIINLTSISAQLDRYPSRGPILHRRPISTVGGCGNSVSG